MTRTIFLVLALAAGCSQNPPAPQGKVNFQDVPIPGGLNYDEGYGNATPSGNIRVYTQELSGKKRPEEIAKFYRETLPIHGWTVGADDGRKLSFTKKEERCDVEIASTADGVKVKVKLDYGKK